VPLGSYLPQVVATAVLGEEPTSQDIRPDRAMLMETALLTLWYTFLIVVFQGIASHATVVNHGSDVLAYARTILVPGLLGRALPPAVLVAILGTNRIQMTEPSRVVYAMARGRLLPSVFGWSNRKHKTPWPDSPSASLCRHYCSSLISPVPRTRAPWMTPSAPQE